MSCRLWGYVKEFSGQPSDISIRAQKGIPMPNDQALLKRFMDEASIRNTIARFADSATRFDTDMFRSVWADDAEFIIGHAPHGQSATGVDDIVAMLRRVPGGEGLFSPVCAAGRHRRGGSNHRAPL